jgi:hypothetical protein
MRLSKVLGVVVAGLFVIAIAMANAGPGTPELLSGGTLLGPGDIGTPTTPAPRAHALPAAKQEPIKAPPPSVTAVAPEGDDVEQNNGRVVLASASTEGPASAPTVAAPGVSPDPAPPTPTASEPVAPQPAPPKPSPPKIQPEPQPEPRPEAPTVTPREGDPKVIVVVVVFSFRDHDGDDVGHEDEAGCDHSGDENGDLGHDGFDHGPEHDGPEHDDSPEAEHEHAGEHAPGQLGDGPAGSLIGAGSEE